ncbi:hypothetical protein ABIA33_004963 [Streptacidiphilus sp. MAP12-16]|uniref:DUF3152 domain-containing protein n=1 Tax=Streptacidiphilus sp. MAP12-16 TaxID=3156300 RepID=UPI00351673E9
MPSRSRRRPPAHSVAAPGGRTQAQRRRRGGGRGRARRKGSRVGGTALSLVVLLTIVAVGGYLLSGAGESRATAAAASGAPSTSTKPSPGPSPSPSPRRLPSAKPSSAAAFPTGYPAKGNGSYSYASGSTARFGTGTLQRYRVAVENGLGVDPALFAAQVDAVLGNTQRGWSAGGQWSFQRVASGPVAFTIYLASPGTAYHLCERLIGLDIREAAPGGVNCSNNGNTVVENIARWIDLTDYYKGQPDLYHALAINHEVGHSLHHGHVSCTGAGDPAPVMMQQIKGLHGCVPNGWPYSASGSYITGAPSP